MESRDAYKTQTRVMMMSCVCVYTRVRTSKETDLNISTQSSPSADVYKIFKALINSNRNLTRASGGGSGNDAGELLKTVSSSSFTSLFNDSPPGEVATVSGNTAVASVVMRVTLDA